MRSTAGKGQITRPHMMAKAGWQEMGWNIALILALPPAAAQAKSWLIGGDPMPSSVAESASLLRFPK
jgi:hypothetical protein